MKKAAKVDIKGLQAENRFLKARVQLLRAALEIDHDEFYKPGECTQCDALVNDSKLETQGKKKKK